MHASSVGPDHREGAIRVVSESDDIVAVSLDGEFDLTNAPALGDQLDETLESGSGLIVDLSEATFIDSSVIHVLARAATAAAGRKQTMVLQLGTAAIVERVLEISALDRVLPRAHDRQEAVRMVRRTAGTA